MNNIHSTAIISSNAKLGNNVKVGSYAIIHDDVVIGDDCEIGPSAVIYNFAQLGNRVKIFQGASVANLPQDLKFDKGKTILSIGDDTTIREFVTLHRGTHATGKTVIGKNCLIMAYSHVAHDCVLGDNIIVANSVQMGGHVEIGDWTIIGGNAAIHQFVKMGSHIMASGLSGIGSDVPPYVMITGIPARFVGLNLIGLKRRGFNEENIAMIKDIYHIFYLSGLTFSKAKEKIEEKFKGQPIADGILQFFEKSTRSILRK
jgi:UDP-N-acetylglucosamine acyltransferase